MEKTKLEDLKIQELQIEQTKTMDVLLVRPNMYPQKVQIGCELEDLQKAVCGSI